jgi:hypothetical protein
MIMKKERNYSIESLAWLIASVLMLSIILASCASSKTCHSNGHYVSKDIKRAQSKPRAH